MLCIVYNFNRFTFSAHSTRTAHTIIAFCGLKLTDGLLGIEKSQSQPEIECTEIVEKIKPHQLPISKNNMRNKREHTHTDRT